MPESGYEYSKPSLNKELMDKIKQFIYDYPELGYRTLGQFVEDAVRRRAEELRVFMLSPRFEHFNTYEDHATIRDKKLGRYVDIYPHRNGELWCENCESTDCEHVQYSLTVPKIVEPLKKQGWKHRQK